jgi:peptidoglycan/xylan/chitin deacetylase (PgdA/CDA1 family)
MRALILTYAALAPIALIALWPVSPLAGIAVLALSHFFLLYATLRPNVQWLGPVITHFDSRANEVWLTIDDGPTDDTPAVLDLFARKQVPATFFVKGELARAQPQLIRDMLAHGHTVANHSESHPGGSLWCSPPARIAREIDGCNEALLAATGTRPVWFRAPVGFKNPFFHPLLQKRGMQLIGWSARGFDAVVGDPDKVLARILPDLRPGAIILLHQGRSFSIRVLEHVIDELRQRGYSFVIPEPGRLKTKR